MPVTRWWAAATSMRGAVMVCGSQESVSRAAAEMLVEYFQGEENQVARQERRRPVEVFLVSREIPDWERVW